VAHSDDAGCQQARILPGQEGLPAAEDLPVEEEPLCLHLLWGECSWRHDAVRPGELKAPQIGS
jgi:hypothetical protein